MGPLELSDLIGMDVCLDIMKVLHQEFGDSKYRPCPLLEEMVDVGKLGRKTGRGRYDYSQARHNPETKGDIPGYDVTNGCGFQPHAA